MNHLGYVKSDNRLSGGVLIEDDIVSCSHCQKAMHLKDWRKKGGWCKQCDSYNCVACAKKTKVEGCFPWRKLVDQALEANYHRVRMFGL